MGSKEAQDFVQGITDWLRDMYEHHAGSETRLEIVKTLESIVTEAIIAGVFEPEDLSQDVEPIAGEQTDTFPECVAYDPVEHEKAGDE